MTTLDAASRQWARRPDDERFLTLDDLAASVGARRDLSRVSDVASSARSTYRLTSAAPCSPSVPRPWPESRPALLGHQGSIRLAAAVALFAARAHPSSRKA